MPLYQVQRSDGWPIYHVVGLAAHKIGERFTSCSDADAKGAAQGYLGILRPDIHEPLHSGVYPDGHCAAETVLDAALKAAASQAVIDGKPVSDKPVSIDDAIALAHAAAPAEVEHDDHLDEHDEHES